MRQLLTTITLLLLYGCATGPDYQAPLIETDDKWAGNQQLKQQDQTGQAADWWARIQDNLLSELIKEASLNNRDLAAAFANIERAKASSSLAGAGYMPSINARASGNRTSYSSQTGFGLNTGTRNNFNATLEASWEPDFFGRTRYAVAKAEADLGAAQSIAEGLKLALIAEVAANYFEIRGLQRQLAMHQEDLRLLQEVENIAAIQAESGTITQLDLARAQGERQAFEARLPNIHAEISSRIYRISVLTGKKPEAQLARLQSYQPQAMPADQVPIGLRSDILKRRPDIQQAERELASATAQVGIRKSALFPSFSLTGSTGSSARVFSDLFTPATLTDSVGALLAWPLYAGGAYSDEVDIARADLKAAVAAYEQQVLLALEDAESALIRYGREWQTLKQLRAAELTRQQAADIAQLRFEAGEEDLLSVLDTRRSLIAIRYDINSSETRILTNLALLYKSLGGGWQQVQP